MIQLLIAILLGLASPNQPTPADQHPIVTNNSTEEEEDDGSGGSGGTGENGQLPPPPITGG